MRSDTGQMLLRFVVGRPVSEATEVLPGWLCEELAKEGEESPSDVLDNAS